MSYMLFQPFIPNDITKCPFGTLARTGGTTYSPIFTLLSRLWPDVEIDTKTWGKFDHTKWGLAKVNSIKIMA